MRIANIAVAASTIAGRGQFFSRPIRARPGLASEWRPAYGPLPGRAGLHQRANSSSACPARPGQRGRHMSVPEQAPRHPLSRPSPPAASALPNTPIAI